ncbi:anti-phage ZorAB system protein ZorA, partial [Glutamicibacter arilaitensis]|uniref:anti-phage ZorAB system protein ZorA n=3 Tax=Glutamicibacter arilaitensis TaxID=256701 RepID=UPI003FD29AA4
FTIMPEWLIENLTTIVIITILAIFLVFMLPYMLRQTKQADSRIKAIRSILDKFEGDDLAAHRMDALEYVRDECTVRMAQRAWTEFDRSLVAVDSGSRKTLKSSVPSSEYFNTETLAGELLHNRVLNLGPGLFTALGVLGTFLGLTVGLAGLDTGDSASTDQLRDGINGLIGGASTAFYTSLAGIMVSLVASGVKGSMERKMIRKVISVQGDIDEKFRRYTPEQALADIALSTQASSASLQELHERIGDQFQKSISGLADGMQEAVAAAITSALSPAMNNLSNSMTEQSNTVFEELVGKFASSFETIGDSQAKQLNNASEELSRSVNVVADEFSAMLAAMSEQHSKSNESAEKSSENFQSQMQQLLTMADEQRSESTRTVAEIKESLSSVSQALSSSSDDLKTVSSTFKDASSKAGGDIATISGQLSTATSHVNTAAQHQSKAVEQLTEHRDQFMLLQQELRELAIHLENAVGKSSDTFSTLGEQQDSFLANLKENVNHVNQSLNDSVSSLTGAMDKWLQDYARSVSTQTATRMEDWNLHSQEYARHMLQVASSLENVLDELPKAAR